MTEIRSKTRREMIESGARLCQLLGLPRSIGQIYGLLFFSTQPMSLDDIVEYLGISKASASNGTRQLSSFGAIRQVWMPGERRDYFEVIDDLNGVIRTGLFDFLKPRLESSRKRLSGMMQSLAEDLERDLITSEEHYVLLARVKKLNGVQEKLTKALPWAEKLI